MAREVNFKPTTYLRINAEGQLYNGVSTPQEGYTQYTSKLGNVSYRKVFSGTEFGHITNLAVVEKIFDSGKVKYVEVTVENEDAKDVIQLPLKNTNGGLSDVVKKLIAVLPGVDYSRELTISSNRKKNDRGYVDKVLFFNYIDGGEFGEGVKFTLKFGEGGDIPMFTTKEGIDGIEYDYTEQDKFLYGKLLEELERFQNFKSAPKVETTEVKDEPKKEAKPTETKKSAKPTTKAVAPKVEVEDEDDDNVPF